jgi:hypothetical protein
MTGIMRFAKCAVPCLAKALVKTLKLTFYSILTSTFAERKREVSFPFFHSINNLELEAGA